MRSYVEVILSKVEIGIGHAVYPPTQHLPNWARASSVTYAGIGEGRMIPQDWTDDEQETAWSLSGLSDFRCEIKFGDIHLRGASGDADQTKSVGGLLIGGMFPNVMISMPPQMLGASVDRLFSSGVSLRLDVVSEELVLKPPAGNLYWDVMDAKIDSMGYPQN